MLSKSASANQEPADTTRGGAVNRGADSGREPQDAAKSDAPGPGPANHPFAPNRDYDYSTNKPNEFPSKQHADYPGKHTAPEYGGNKQLPNEAERGVHHQNEMEEHYVSKIGNLGAGPGAFPGQPRFLSGQSISQATGPTPTLNQLLQASSPMHRFHSNYPGIGPESYQQPWPMQRPPVVPPVYPQPGQRPPQTVFFLHFAQNQSKRRGISFDTNYQ